MKSKRRYLQFSLGTMFAAVTVLCIWLGVQVKWMRDRQEARKWLREHDCRVIGNSEKRLLDDDEYGPVTFLAPWSIRLFGEEGVYCIVLNENPDSSTSTPRHWRRLFPESIIITHVQKPIP